MESTRSVLSRRSLLGLFLTALGLAGLSGCSLPGRNKRPEFDTSTLPKPERLNFTHANLQRIGDLYKAQNPKALLVFLAGVYDGNDNVMQRYLAPFAGQAIVNGFDILLLQGTPILNDPQSNAWSIYGHFIPDKGQDDIGFISHATNQVASDQPVGFLGYSNGSTAAQAVIATGSVQNVMFGIDFHGWLPSFPEGTTRRDIPYFARHSKADGTIPIDRGMTGIVVKDYAPPTYDFVVPSFKELTDWWRIKDENISIDPEGDHYFPQDPALHQQVIAFMNSCLVNQ